MQMILFFILFIYSVLVNSNRGLIVFTSRIKGCHCQWHTQPLLAGHFFHYIMMRFPTERHCQRSARFHHHIITEITFTWVLIIHTPARHQTLYTPARHQTLFTGCI